MNELTVIQTSPTVVTMFVHVDMWSASCEADHSAAEAYFDAVVERLPIIPSEVKTVRKAGNDVCGQFETNAMALIFANADLTDEAMEWLEDFCDEVE